MDPKIAVIGLGAMGAAIATQLVRSGFDVTVWNRTPSKAEPLKALGATVAGTYRDAILSSDVIITLLGCYADIEPILDECSEELAGKAVINLITGSPDHIRKLRSQVEKTNGTFLSGTILCYPSDIGSSVATIFLGGSPELWERQKNLLTCLAGNATYLGSLAELPNILDTSIAGCFFFTAHSAFLEAAAYAAKEGVDIKILAQFLPSMIKGLRAQLEDSIVQIAAGDFSTQQATLLNYQRSMGVFETALSDAGASSHLLSANRRRIIEAVEAGDGDLSYHALFKH